MNYYPDWDWSMIHDWQLTEIWDFIWQWKEYHHMSHPDWCEFLLATWFS
jgi:hypothetical protein